MKSFLAGTMYFVLCTLCSVLNLILGSISFDVALILAFIGQA